MELISWYQTDNGNRLTASEKKAVHLFKKRLQEKIDDSFNRKKTRALKKSTKQSSETNARRK